MVAFPFSLWACHCSQGSCIMFESYTWAAVDMSSPTMPLGKTVYLLFTISSQIRHCLCLFPIGSWVTVHTPHSLFIPLFIWATVFVGSCVCVSVCSWASLIRAGKSVWFFLPSKTIPLRLLYIAWNNKLWLSFQFLSFLSSWCHSPIFCLKSICLFKCLDVVQFKGIVLSSCHYLQQNLYATRFDK